MIIGVWLLVRNWRDRIDRKLLYLVAIALSLFIISVIARAVQLHMFVKGYEIGNVIDLQRAESMFLDKRGNSQEQLLISFFL